MTAVKTATAGLLPTERQTPQLNRESGAAARPGGGNSGALNTFSNTSLRPLDAGAPMPVPGCRPICSSGWWPMPKTARWSAVSVGAKAGGEHERLPSTRGPGHGMALDAGSGRGVLLARRNTLSCAQMASCSASDALRGLRVDSRRDRYR